jgi:hypothetical protein
MAEDSESVAICSQGAWLALNSELPTLLDQLVTADPFNTSSPPASLARGIYLFSDETEHLYVGRTGVSARSRKFGKCPSTSFAVRWSQHTSAGSAPNSAPFAMKLAYELAAYFDLMIPSDLKRANLIEKTAEWWSLRKEPSPPDFYLAFQEAKRFIGEELSFRYLPLVDDTRGVRSHVAEVYADVILQTTYGDFSPS